MKKFLMIIPLCISIFIISGCGGKKLVCTKEEETTKDMWIKQEMAMTFQKGKIETIQLKREVKVAGDFVKTIDILEKSLKEEFTSFNDKAVKVKSSRRGKTVKISASANYKKMKDETRKSFGTAPYDKNEKEMKKFFEDQGFTCK